MSDVATPTTAASDRRQTRRVAGAVAVVVGLGAALLVYDNWRQQRAWREACAEADRLDPGWRWQDLTAAPAPPDEQNSVAHTRAAARLLSAIPAGIENQAAHLSPQERPSARFVNSLRDRLAAMAPALVEIRRLADCPEGRITLPAGDMPLNFAFDPPPMDFLHVTRRLPRAQLVLQLEDGDLDGAVVSLRAMVYLARPLVDCLIFMHALVASACHVHTAQAMERLLAQAEPSDAVLDAARRLLEPEAGRTPLLAGFRGERAFVEEMMRGLDEGRVSQADLAKLQMLKLWTGWPEVDRWLSGLGRQEFRRSDAIARLRHVTWMIERLKESPDGLLEHADEWTALRRQLPRGVEERVDMALHVAQVGANEAQFRCAVVALAAEQFRRAHGHWPASLSELVPEYLTAVPPDPFDRRPLKLARRADGLVIYSLGADGKDDGGDVVPGGVPQGRDVGVRLWDVNRRRQPPAPKPTAAAKGPGR